MKELPDYADKTALFITNDHGRHANGHKDGFISHGDGCASCRHISLLALGPDFKPNAIVEEAYGQIDISATIGQLLQFPVISYGGKPIKPLIQHGEPIY